MENMDVYNGLYNAKENARFRVHVDMVKKVCALVDEH